MSHSWNPDFPTHRQSLVRWISHILPLPKARRIHLQRELIANNDLPIKAVGKDDQCAITRLSLADVGWLVQEPSECDVISRAEAFGYQDKNFSTTLLEWPACAPPGLLDSGCCCSTPTNGISTVNSPFLRRQLGPPTSTPSKPVMSSQDPLTSKRITELEQELAKLRLQMALIIQSQEGMAVGSMSIGSVCESNATINNTTTMCAPPPLPPPPPPPPPAPVTSQSVNDIIRKRKLDRQQSENPNDDTGSLVKKIHLQQPPAVDMSQVLKDIGSVRLKSVARSPGGTPMREPPISNANDPASIIARALRKKFAKVASPQSDGEHSPLRKSSPQIRSSQLFTSSAVVPGPHMLRPAVKKNQVSSVECTS